MLDAGRGLELAHRVGGHRGELGQPGLAPPGKRYPALVEPVDRARNLAADFVGKSLLAMLAKTERGPEGHVEADALEIEHLADLRDERADVLAIGRVRAQHAVPAAFALRFAVDASPSASRDDCRRPSDRRSGWCRSRRRSGGRGSARSLRPGCCALEPAMLLADLGGIVEQSDVRLAVGHDRLGPRLDQHLDITIGVELAEKRSSQSGMCMSITARR